MGTLEQRGKLAQAKLDLQRAKATLEEVIADADGIPVRYSLVLDAQSHTNSAIALLRLWIVSAQADEAFGVNDD
jgi:hypothetical protein